MVQGGMKHPDEMQHYLSNFGWSVLTAILLLCFAAYAKADSMYTPLQALDACFNEASIAAAIQVGRVIENDDMQTFLSRLALWPTDYEVQHDESGASTPIAQGLLDYIQGVGIYVFNTFPNDATERQVGRGSLEHCLSAWREHFDHGAPAPVFYQFPIGFSEPVYSYDGGG